MRWFCLAHCLSGSDEESDAYLVDWINAKGESPLCIACQKNSEESIVVSELQLFIGSQSISSVSKTLLQLGASVHLHDIDGNTPLHHASAYGNLEAIQILLQWHANAFVKNNMGYTASDYAFSFEVEQHISTAVRSVLEAEKRARKLKGQASAVRPPSALAEDGLEADGAAGVAMSPRPIPLSPLPSSLTALRMAAVFVPPLIPGSARSAASATPQTPTQRHAFSTPATGPDTEHRRALQRIYAREHNAQYGFQTSAAYHDLVGPSFPLKSPSSSGITALSMRRERSTSTDMTSASSSSSIISTMDGPASRVSSLPRSELPLPAPPDTPLPPLEILETKKSSTSAFVARLQKSGSNGGPTAQSSVSAILEPALVLQKTITPGSGRLAKGSGLKQHTSIADLRSSVRETERATSIEASGSTDAMPPYTPALHKSGFHFGVFPRTRSGT